MRVWCYPLDGVRCPRRTQPPVVTLETRLAYTERGQRPRCPSPAGARTLCRCPSRSPRAAFAPHEQHRRRRRPDSRSPKGGARRAHPRVPAPRGAPHARGAHVARILVPPDALDEPRAPAGRGQAARVPRAGAGHPPGDRGRHAEGRRRLRARRQRLRGAAPRVDRQALHQAKRATWPARTMRSLFHFGWLHFREVVHARSERMRFGPEEERRRTVIVHVPSAHNFVGSRAASVPSR